MSHNFQIPETDPILKLATSSDYVFLSMSALPAKGIACMRFNKTAGMLSFYCRLIIGPSTLWRLPAAQQVPTRRQLQLQQTWHVWKNRKLYSTCVEVK